MAFSDLAPAASSDMAAMRAELAKVASMLQQLRAGAQLERAAGAGRLAVRACVQGSELFVRGGPHPLLSPKPRLQLPIRCWIPRCHWRPHCTTRLTPSCERPVRTLTGRVTVGSQSSTLLCCGRAVHAWTILMVEHRSCATELLDVPIGTGAGAGRHASGLAVETLSLLPLIFTRAVTAAVSRLQVQAQGPADLRSVTVTSVHPLALEHTAILRAHFGVCGRIVRATVLRNQATGEAAAVPSSRCGHGRLRRTCRRAVSCWRPGRCDAAGSPKTVGRSAP